MVASPALAASHCCHAVGDKKLASSQGPKKLVSPPSWPRIRLSWHMPKSPKFRIIFFVAKTSRKFENEPKSPKLGNHGKMTCLTSWVSQVYEWFQNGPPYIHNPSCIAQRVQGVQPGSFKVVALIDKWTSALKDGHTSTELLRLWEWIWIAPRLLRLNTLTTLEKSNNPQKTDTITIIVLI